MSGLYTGSSGIISNMIKLNNHSNNLANVSTEGFKKDVETFKTFDETYKKINFKDKENKIGSYTDQVYVDNIHINFEEGTMKVSGNQLDMMLNDNKDSGEVSFFSIESGGKEYLTRNGVFTLDANRNLSTLNGGIVLDVNNNKINIPDGIKYNINAEGEIKKENGDLIAKMKLISVEDRDLQLLKKEGGNYFSVMNLEEINKNYGNLNKVLNDFDNNPTLRDVFGSKERIINIIENGEINITKEFTGNLKTNVLEGSNVDMSEELIGLMNAQKNINSNQKSMTIMDKIFDKEANQIGK